MTDHYGDARTKNRASTRALMKRSGYADGGDVRPSPRPMYGDEDMGGVEKNNFDVMRNHSNKDWSTEEARDMATNPSGRLPSAASMSRIAATGPAPYDPNVDSVSRDMMAAKHKPKGSK